MRILEDMRLKVALPNECNDPFEFTPCSKASLTRKYMPQELKDDPEHYRPLYDYLVELGFSQSFSEFLRPLPEHIRKNFPEVIKLHRSRLVHEDLRSRDDASQTAGVLCLSTLNHSVPMWSHYADHHRGVVIGMNRDDAAFSHGIAGEVKYLKRLRVRIDPFAAAGTQLWWEQINRTIFSKSREWAYEREFRIAFRLADLPRGKLENGNTAYFVDIWQSTIDSIVLGCLISPEDEKRIYDVVKSKLRFSKVRILRAQRHERFYSLDVLSGAGRQVETLCNPSSGR